MTAVRDGELANRFAGVPVTVTGGCGFIGSNLVRTLASLGARVTVLDVLMPDGGANQFNLHGVDGDVAIHALDVRDDAGARKLLIGQRYLFHLAAQTSHVDSVRNPALDLDINAKGTLSLLEICKAVSPNVHVVFASTRQVYGKPRHLPVDETHVLDPPDFNAVHKLAAESYLTLMHRLYGMTSATLRLTNTYGPRMRIKDARQMFLGVWIRNLLESRTIEIFGDGLQRRDFNHVDDVVDALLRAAGVTGSASCFNLGSPENVTLLELAETMIAIAPGNRFAIVPFPPDRKAIDIGDFQGDYSRFHDATGWEPRISLAAGLRGTVDFFSKHREYYR